MPGGGVTRQDCRRFPCSHLLLVNNSAPPRAWWLSCASRGMRALGPKVTTQGARARKSSLIMYIYRLRKSEIKEMHSKLTRAEGRLLVRDFARTSFECPPDTRHTCHEAPPPKAPRRRARAPLSKLSAIITHSGIWTPPANKFFLSLSLSSLCTPEWLAASDCAHRAPAPERT